MTAFSIRSCDSHVSIFAIADEMEKKGRFPSLPTVEHNTHIGMSNCVHYGEVVLFSEAKMWLLMLNGDQLEGLGCASPLKY